MREWQKLSLAAVVISIMSCTHVVMESSSEVRPSRYAALEFTQQLAARDSAIAYARRALTAEQVELQPDAGSGVIMGGPLHFDAAGNLPALDAHVTITVETQGTATKFTLYASAILEPDEVGGVDARLMALLQRVSKRLESMIAS